MDSILVWKPSIAQTDGDTLRAKGDGNTVDEWWQEWRRSREEGYISQIRRSRKHMQRGLTRSQNLFSSPIDFFLTSMEKARRIELRTCQGSYVHFLTIKIY